MHVLCLESFAFAFSMRILLVGSFYLKGIHSILFVNPNKWLKKNVKKCYMLFLLKKGNLRYIIKAIYCVYDGYIIGFIAIVFWSFAADVPRLLGLLRLIG
jgi:hypothetical protein